MILGSQLTEIGRFGLPHGIKGELNSEFHDVSAEEIAALRCIVCNIDGIFVPFFIASVRPRSSVSLLLTIDGINDENEATLLQNHPIFALADDPALNTGVDNDESDASDGCGDGFYAEDLIGYTVDDENSSFTGTIIEIDDSTDNILFIVESPLIPSPVMIPVADELIAALNPETRHITFSLPAGLTDINTRRE